MNSHELSRQAISINSTLQEFIGSKAVYWLQQCTKEFRFCRVASNVRPKKHKSGFWHQPRSPLLTEDNAQGMQLEGLMHVSGHRASPHGQFRYCDLQLTFSHCSCRRFSSNTNYTMQHPVLHTFEATFGMGDLSCLSHPATHFSTYFSLDLHRFLELWLSPLTEETPSSYHVHMCAK